MLSFEKVAQSSFCIHRVNRVNSRNGSAMTTAL